MSTRQLRAAAALLVALLIALATARVAGAEPPTLEELAASIDRAATEPDGFRVVVGHVSRVLRMSVEALRAQQSRTGLGWGELLIANHLATRTGLSFDQVVAESRGGKRWADIAAAHGAEVDALRGDVEHSADVVAHRAEDEPPRIDPGSRPPATPPAGSRPGLGGRGRY